jgi:gliding motility-associated-like protein
MKFKPVLSNIPAALEVSCEESIPTELPTATDNCDTDVVVTFADSEVTGSCPQEKIITRTFTATDECGNTATASQTITVTDDVSPQFDNAPGDITADCNDVPNAPANIAATDNCDPNVDITFGESIEPGLCPESFKIIRTWAATDDCGNTTLHFQEVSVGDNEAPVITGVPPNTNADCDAIPNVPLPTDIVVTDNCDINPSLTFAETSAPGICNNSEIITRTWTATDACGNISTATQTITVGDGLPPVITGVPADISAECSAIPPTPTDVTVTDNCDANPSLDFEETILPGGCPEQYSLVRTWTATDDCGNTTEASQLIIVDDTIAPELSNVPADISVDCNNIPPAANPIATDNCDLDVEITFDESVVNNDCGQGIIREWTATDNCGNSIQLIQTITVEDNENPVIVGVPADISAECSNIPAVPSNVTASDNCDTDVELTVEDIILDGACPAQYSIQRTWTATDDCGNIATQSQLIIVDDTIAPELVGVPADTDVDCNNIPTAASVTGTDNCDTDVEVIFDENIVNNACGQTITRTWTATDDCGLTEEATQTINVIDNEAPQILNIPADISAECSNIPPVANNVTATDNCDTDVELTVEDVTLSGACENQYTLQRIWTATDDCGNVTTAQQLIIVDDTTAPELVGVPSDEAVSCNEIPTVPAPGVVTATDNCDIDVEVLFEEVVVDNACGQTITRTWTATDNCGNTTAATQEITVGDIEAPVLDNIPADITAECDDIPTSINPTVSDDCDTDISVLFSDVITLGACDDSYIITRKWTATDDCGNSTSAEQIVTVEDTTPPTIAGVPSDIDADCNTIPDPPTAGDVVATDNCDTDVELIFDEQIVNDGCGQTITRTWIATDDCGLTTEAIQTINIGDTEAPVISGIPADISAECSAIPSVPNNVTATDNCDIDVELTVEDILLDGSCPAQYSIQRTWTAIDDCGNETVESQLIIVDDTTAPELVGVPVDIDSDCTVGAPAPPIVTGTDNCDTNVEVIFEETVENSGCGQTITRTWTAIDDCGNSNAATQTITIGDTELPQITGVPADISSECSDLPSVDPNVVATDNCDTDVELNFDENILAGSCEGQYTLERIWTAIDDCGNEAIATQIIIVDDTTAPELENVPANLDAGCNNIPNPPAPGVVTATDGCDPNVTITFEEQIEDNGCGQTITRTWMATDDCGNTSDATQVINVGDTEGPQIIGVPADIAVNCDEIPTLPNPNTVTATDNCDTDVELTFNENTIPGLCAGSYTLERIWTATDDCGNTIVDTQTITVGDFDAPIIANVPADISAECSDIPPISIDVTVTDNCDTDVELSFEENILPGACQGQYTLERIWIATDDCGNETTATQIIIIDDTTAPVIVGVPADVIGDCNNIPNVPPTGTISATDNCDTDVEIIFDEVIVDNACGQTITRTWTATDDCGNSTAESQTITIGDMEAPELLNMPSDITVECDDIPTSINPTVSDNCDTDIPILFSDIITPGACDDSYIITRTWTATDDCGNTTTAQQIVTIEDNTAPELIGVPDDVSGGCDDIPVIPPVGMISSTDNCDTDVELTFEEVIVDNACGQTITRTWTATDDCGNSISESQIIAVGDDGPPIITNVPADLTTSCDNIPTTPIDVTVSDECDSNIDLIFTEENQSGDCPGNYSIIRTWSATDDCGNTTEITQIIIVQDTEAPGLTGVPVDITGDCNNIPNVPPVGTITATDNCDTDVEILFEEVIVDNSCGQTITRTWTATDDCGNSNSASQVITVGDTEAPDLTGVPVDITVECDNIPTSIDPTVSDDCDSDILVLFSDIITLGSCDDSYIIIRTWTATDDCGNSTSAQQIVTVEDNTPPTLVGVPTDIDVGCGNLPDPPAPGVVTANDACDTDVEVIFNEEAIAGGDCGDGIKRTWTATDNCGNVVTATQIVSVSDTTPPVLANVPADVTVECDNIPTADDPTATDNCDDNVEVLLTETVTPGACLESYKIVRTWTASDDCGNTIVVTQEVSVYDNTPPVLTNIPIDITVSCGDEVPAPPASGVVTTTDNCSTDLTINFEESSQSTACGEIITRKWMSTDGCGNTVEEIQTITVEDTEAPILTNIPADVMVECSAIPTAVDPTVTDNCDTDIDVNFSDIITPGACENAYTITRTWTATDDCGNETSASQVIFVNDTTAPEMVGIPADFSGSCNDDPGIPNITATDDCDQNVDIVLDENTELKDCGATITRIWTATDNCGNTVSQTQIVELIDTQAPVFLTLPADVTVDCDNIPTSEDLEVEDDCADNIQVSFSDIITPGACATDYVIIRTWTATDLCGNAIETTQTIVVLDVVAPVFDNVPTDADVDCKDGVPALPTVTATDNCDTNPEVIFEEKTEDTDCGEIITRTWTATDACGNSEVATQILDLSDSEAPVFVTLPADLTVDCDNIPTSNDLEVEDNCDTDISVLFSDIIIPGACANDYILMRTWTATDDCGNSIETTQQIVILDVTAPVFDEIPQNAIVNCGDIPAIPTLTAIDGCDTNVEILYEESSVTTACGETITRKWTAIDDCGNPEEVEQVITVEDSEPPQLPAVPADLTIACDQVPDPPVNVTATDDCDDDVTVVFLEIMDPEMCQESYTITRTWTATDDCGNETSKTQLITAVDDVAPQLIGVPADVTVNLGNGDQIPDIPTGIFATDNCDLNVDIDFSEVNIPNADGYVLIWSWIATDNCGNFTEEVMNVTVIESITDIQISPQDPVMCGGGTIQLQALPDDPTFTYEWTATGGTFDQTTGQSVNFTITDIGTFIVTVNVTNLAGTTASAATQVTVNDVPDIVSNSNSPLCVGDELQLTSNPGADNYSWIGPNGFTSDEQNPSIQDVTTLASGQYILTAQFGVCEAVDTVQVEIETYPDFAIEVVDGDCMDKGTITLTNQGQGTAFTFNWEDISGNDNDQNRTDLGAGIYSVTISNSSGCETILENLEIEFTNTLLASSTIDQQSNCGQADGAATVEVTSGGSGNYNYEWPNGNTDASRNDLAAGNYEVTITDIDTGCETTAIVAMIVADMAPAFVAVEGASTSCPGATDGMAQYIISYDQNFIHPADTVFVDENGLIVENGELPAGNYCLQIFNGLGCLVAQGCFEIVNPTPVTATYDVTPADCVTLGTITLNSNGGTGQTKYDWEDVPGNDNFKDRFDLVAGTYSVTVYDQNGCDFILNDIEVVDSCEACIEPDILNVTTINADCLTPNGTASIELDGDPSDFNFYWNPPVSTSNSSTTLSAAFYHVTISRKNDPSCLTETTIVINNNGGPQPTDIKVTPDNCGAGNGSVEFFPTDLLYLWDMDNQLMSTRTDLAAGTYYVAVIDPQNAGCPTNLVIEVDSVDNLGIIENIITQPTCGNANGEVEIQATGGSNNFEYLWNDGDTNQSRSGLAAGTFSVTVTDIEIGCMGEYTFDLNEQISVVSVTVADTTVTCFAMTDGYVDYDLDFDPDFAQPANVLIVDANNNEFLNGSLPVGNYCIKVFDANDCFAGEGCFEITEPEKLTIDFTVENKDCDHGGSISLEVTGGTGDYTFDWSNGGTTSEIFDLDAGIYTVTVTDENGCSTTFQNAEVLDECNCQTPTVVSTSFTDATCNQNNGTALIILDGDPLDFEYTWTPNVSNSNVATDLPAGDYQVGITVVGDTCSTTVDFTINDQGEPVVNIDSTTPATCALANGTAALSPITYVFEWSDGNNGAIRNDLVEGTYEVTVTDNSINCSTTISVDIESTNPLEIQAIINTEPMCGEANGSVTISPNLVGNYTYAWSDGSNAETRNDLAASTYSVSATDIQTGCITETTFTLNDNISGATVTTQDVSLDCYGDTNGTVIYEVDLDSGFATPETIEIRDNLGNVYQNGALTAGNYCVIVLDANGCQAGESCFEVTEPLQIELDSDVSNKDCDSNGAITTNVMGGTQPYLFDWDDLADNDDPQHRSDLAVGTYILTVTDANDCSLIFEFTIEDDCVPTDCDTPEVISVSTTDAHCGSGDGSTNIMMSDDPVNYLFAWTNDVSSTNEASGLLAGTYVVTITNSDDTCSTEVMVLIEDLDGPAPQVLSITAATCGNADGSAQFAPDYDFVWSDGGLGASRNDLEAGIYTVTVTDQFDCVEIVEIEITDDCTTIGCNDPVVLSVDIQDANCGGTDGGAMINMDGDVNNFTFEWEADISDSNIATGLGAGMYQVTITTVGDTCKTELEITINNIDNPTATIQSLTNATCEAADGSVTLSPANYNYSWSDGGAGFNRNDLAAGTYEVTVADPNTGCLAYLTIEILSENNFTATATPSNADCQNGGSIILSLNDGTAPYTFDWADLVGNDDPQHRNDLIEGTYSVTILDSNGCEAILDGIVIGDDCQTLPCEAPEVLFIDTDDATCGNADGIAEINVNGNPNDFTFEWTNNVSTSNVADNLAAGTYNVTITIINDTCATEITVLIGNENGPTPQILNTTPATCGQANGTAQLSPNYDYTWSDGGTGAFRDGLSSGTYQVTATDVGTGCVEVFEIEIDETNPLELQFTINTQPSCGASNGAVSINPSITGDYLFEWSDNGTGDLRIDLAAGTYAVTATDTNSGCDATVIFTLTDNVSGATVTIQNVQTTCFGTTNATAIYDVTLDPNFAEPASIEIKNTNGNSVQNGNLGVGSYCIVVTDANGCVAGEGCFEVTEPQSLIASVNSQNANCNVGGQIDLTINGGTPNYTFEWSDGDTNEDRIDLAIGTYSVTVTDENGCQKVLSNITIEDDCQTGGCDEPVVLNILTNDATCGNSDGSATIEIQGNLTDFNVEWNDGGTGATRNDLEKGTYTVTISWANDPTCQTIVTVEIEDDCTTGCSAPIVTEIQTSDATCAISDGAATIEVEGNWIDYVWTWSGGVSTINSAQNLAAGTYSVTISQPLDPTCNTILTIEISEDCTTQCDEPVISNIIINDANCGESDGTAIIQMVGNLGDFSFLWQNGISDENIATNLLAGTYGITITQQSDSTCFIETSIFIGDTDGPQMTITDATPANCNAADGSASLSPNTYSYQWSDGGTGASRSNLSAGTYSVTATDSSTGCVNVIEVVVEESSDLEAGAQILAQPTCGNADGSVSILVQNGNGNYNYEWSNGGVGNTQNNLIAGIYTVTITDNISGCETTTQFTLSDEVIGATILVDDLELTCAGATDGEVIFDINYENGFIQPASVEILDAQNNAVQNGHLKAGIYCINILDGNGCLAATECFEVIEPSEIQVVVSTIDKDCTNGGQINLEVNGGSGNYTYNWNDGATTDNRNKLDEGIYDVTITDENGCEVIISNIEIVDDCIIGCIEPVILNTTITDATCGNADGTASIEVEGSVNDYTFTWTNNVSTTNVSTGLSSGIYEVTVSWVSDPSCQTITQIEIGDDCVACIEPVITNITTIDATCGENNGSAIIELTGNSNTYTYTWSNALNSTNTAIGLAAGTYGVTIANQNDSTCFIETFIVIGNQNGPQAMVSSVSAATCTAANGSALLTPVSYFYLWEDGVVGDSRDDLTSGTYFVTVTDPITDCIEILTVEIGQNSSLSTQVEITKLPDCGASNGSVNILISNGSGDYAVNWNDGGIGASRNDLVGGVYEVTIIDNQTGCQAIQSFTLTEKIIGATVIVKDTKVTCIGATNASAPYDIILDPGFATPETIEIQDENGNVVIDGTLGVGSYCVIVYDANGCIGGQDCFEVLEPEPIQVEVIKSNKDCNLGGVITLNISGGTPDYTFNWGDLNVPNEPQNRIHLEAGFYSVTIIDANGCDIVVENIEIKDDCIASGCDEPVVANFITMDATCGNENGSATIEMVGDLANYTFTWNPLVSLTNQANDLEAGEYFVTIAQAVNPDCFTVLNLIIENADGPQAQVIDQTAADCGEANGTATLDPPNLDYSWSDGAAGATRDDLAAGIYTVVFYDNANGCFSLLEVEILQNSLLSATVNIIAEPSCGEANGSAEINVMGGSGNYAYSWGVGNTRNDLVGGAYSVTITDVDTDCITILQFALGDNVPPGEVVLSTDVIPISCMGSADGEVIYDVNYDPNFVQPSTIEIKNEFGVLFQNGDLSAGYYSIIVFDGNGCMAGEAMFEVVEPEMLNMGVLVTPITCDEGGIIKLEVTGGTEPYEYLWADLPNSTDLDIRTNLLEGMYAVTVVDAVGCQVKVEVEIEDDCITSGCDELFLTDTTSINVPYCDGAELCVPITFTEMGEWIITDNGQPFVGDIKGCDFDSTYTYDYSNVFGNGIDGPYFLNQWMLNGTAYNGQFQNIENMVVAMNSWDPAGNWILDVSTLMISGGNGWNNYGDITITHQPTGAIAILELNSQLNPMGTAVLLTPGEHELIFSNLNLGCADTINVNVQCGEVEYMEAPLFVNTMDTICFDVSWLPGTIVTIENICEDNSGEYILADLQLPNCVILEGIDIGTEVLCIVICDDLGFCDTTYLTVQVIESSPSDLPIAVDDIDDTFKDQPVVIKVMENDTLNGDMTSITIVDPPSYGIVLINLDGTISYTPDNNYCEPEEADFFTYMICNSSGCDTATVYITVDCEKYVIFSGFSPNGDGINETFTIQGIERMHGHNKLLVFNRWGNEVYRSEDYQNDWEGTAFGKDLPDGTYFYLFEDDEGRKVSGYVQIRR